MKLIARRNIFRVPMDVDIIKLERPDPAHPKQISKGEIFRIGEAATPAKDLRPAEQQLGYLLNASAAIGDANDPKLVKAIQDEIALEKKREANVDAINKNAAAVTLLNQLGQVLGQMNALAQTAEA